MTNGHHPLTRPQRPGVSHLDGIEFRQVPISTFDLQYGYVGVLVFGQ